MDATLTTWCSCNEETQWHYDFTNKNNNNAISINNIDNNNKSINNMSNINNNNNNTISNNSNSNNNDTKVTFNQCKANEMRQTHLQRQRDNQQSSTLLLNSEKSAHSSPLPHRLTRRKRLQRQKPTELDDVDFAYAADLEEEDEEDEDLTQQQQQHQKPTTLFTNGPLLGLSRSEQVSTPHTFTNSKRLQQHFQHPFDGQPSSLPTNNAYITSTSMLNIHQHHLQNHQLQHQHLHYHLPPHRERRLKHEESFDSSTTTTTNTTDTATSPASPALRRHNFSLLKRDNSTYSDSSSHYSSVDSLLEARKPDPEAILINLGFGPVGSEDILSRIPKRFLKPSQVRGIDTEAFVRRLQLASNLADHSVLGYRGLTGNPDIPPSRIVAKIMQRFEVNERKKSMGSIEQII